MRGLACLICIAALAAASTASAAGPSAAPASHVAKRCEKISGGKYRVRARIVSCDFAVRSSRAYLRNGSRPRGYSCSRPGGTVALYCRKGDRTFWAERP
jgi:curli biogenesis system outer membrane secretion channel CsgG